VRLTAKLIEFYTAENYFSISQAAKKIEAKGTRGGKKISTTVSD